MVELGKVATLAGISPKKYNTTVVAGCPRPRRTAWWWCAPILLVVTTLVALVSAQGSKRAIRALHHDMMQFHNYDESDIAKSVAALRYGGAVYRYTRGRLTWDPIPAQALGDSQSLYETTLEDFMCRFLPKQRTGDFVYIQSFGDACNLATRPAMPVFAPARFANRSEQTCFGQVASPAYYWNWFVTNMFDEHRQQTVRETIGDISSPFVNRTSAYHFMGQVYAEEDCRKTLKAIAQEHTRWPVSFAETTEATGFRFHISIPGYGTRFSDRTSLLDPHSVLVSGSNDLMEVDNPLRKRRRIERWYMAEFEAGRDYVDVDCANLRYELAQLELNQTLQWKHMARRSARKARLLFQDDVVQNFMQTLYDTLAAKFKPGPRIQGANPACKS